MRTVAIEHVSQNLYTEWLDLLKASPTAGPFSYASLLTDYDQAATVRESGKLIALAHYARRSDVASNIFISETWTTRTHL
jgi:hypothetical protein